MIWVQATMITNLKTIMKTNLKENHLTITMTEEISQTTEAEAEAVSTEEVMTEDSNPREMMIWMKIIC